uniref:Putative DNA-dependent RNA polymerase protein n=1 Tax=uncultured marine virus TaxID=186617 RepID=A0A0F7L5M3_9VIRU|nr:putative DNA-dependent RNA polymerase protein [uncultured marine virus]
MTRNPLGVTHVNGSSCFVINRDTSWNQSMTCLGLVNKVWILSQSMSPRYLMAGYMWLRPNTQSIPRSLRVVSYQSAT